MVTKRNSLGRGLGSLLNNNNQNNSLFEEININQIEINPDQPRKKFNDKSLKELSISIKNYGIIQPITVRKLSENRFQLISGERRFRASKLSLSHAPQDVVIISEKFTRLIGLVIVSSTD